jgi:ABC-type multidrug transport system ATPase subunit
MQSNILRLDCLCHDNFELSNISCEFDFGSVYILSNNRQNNTLLKIISSLDVQKSGRLMLNEYDVSINRDFYRKYISYYSSDIDINHKIGVKSYLKYISRINGHKLYNVAIRYFDLDKVVFSKINKLNQSEKTRLLLASILCKDANILAMVNPYKNLDVKYQKKVSDLISSRIENDGIVFIIADDINELQNILLKESIKYQYFEL